MKLKKIMLVSFILLAILMIGAVNAADTTDSLATVSGGGGNLNVLESPMTDSELLGDDGDSEIEIDEEAYVDDYFIDIKLHKDAEGYISVNNTDKDNIILTKDLSADDWNKEDDGDGEHVHYYINGQMLNLGVGEYNLNVTYFKNDEEVTSAFEHVALIERVPHIEILDEVYFYENFAIVELRSDAEGRIVVSDGGENVYLDVDLKDDEFWEPDHQGDFNVYHIKSFMLNPTLNGNQHINVTYYDSNDEIILTEEKDVTIWAEKIIEDQTHEVTIKINFLINIIGLDTPIVSIRACNDAKNNVIANLFIYDEKFTFERKLNEFDSELIVVDEDPNYNWYLIKPSCFQNDHWDDGRLELTYELDGGDPPIEVKDVEIPFVPYVHCPRDISVISNYGFITVQCPNNATGKIKVNVTKSDGDSNCFEKDVLPGGCLSWTVSELNINSAGEYSFSVYNDDEEICEPFTKEIKSPIDISEFYFTDSMEGPIILYMEEITEANVTVIGNGITELINVSLTDLGRYESHWGVEYYVSSDTLGLQAGETYEVEVTLNIDGYEPIKKSGNITFMEPLTNETGNIKLTVYPADFAVGSGELLFYVTTPLDANGKIIVTCEGNTVFEESIVPEPEDNFEYEFENDCSEISFTYAELRLRGGELNYYVATVNGVIIKQGIVDPDEFDWDHESWDEAKLTFDGDFKTGDKFVFYNYGSKKFDNNDSFTRSGLNLYRETEYRYIVWLWKEENFVRNETGTFTVTSSTGGDESLINIEDDGYTYYVYVDYTSNYFEASVRDLDFIDVGTHDMVFTYFDENDNPVVSISTQITFVIGESDDAGIWIDLDSLCDPCWYVSCESNCRVIFYIGEKVVYNGTLKYEPRDDKYSCDIRYDEFEFEFDMGNCSDVTLFVYGNGGQKTEHYDNIYIQGVREEVDLNDPEIYAVGVWCPWEDGEIEITFDDGSQKQPIIYQVQPGDKNTYLKFNLTALEIAETCDYWVEVKHDGDWICDGELMVVNKNEFYTKSECDWFYDTGDVFLVWCPEDGEGTIYLNVENGNEITHPIEDSEKGTYIGFTLQDLGITSQGWYDIDVYHGDVRIEKFHDGVEVPNPIYLPEYKVTLPKDGYDVDYSMQLVQLELPEDVDDTLTVTVTIDGNEYFNGELNGLDFYVENSRKYYRIYTSNLTNPDSLSGMNRVVVVFNNSIENERFISFHDRNINSSGRFTLEIFDGEYGIDGGYEIVKLTIEKEGDEGPEGKIILDLTDLTSIEWDIRGDDLEREEDDDNYYYWIHLDNIASYQYGIYNDVNVTYLDENDDEKISNTGNLRLMGDNANQVDIWDERDENGFVVLDNERWICFNPIGHEGNVVIKIGDGVKYDGPLNHFPYEDGQYHISPDSIGITTTGNHGDVIITYYDNDDYSYQYWGTSATFVVSTANAWFNYGDNCILFFDDRIIDFHISNKTDGLLTIKVNNGDVVFSKYLSEITENETGPGGDFYYCIRISDINITPGAYVNLTVSYVGDDGYTYESDFRDEPDYDGHFTVYWSRANAFLYDDQDLEYRIYFEDYFVDLHISDKAIGHLNISLDDNVVFSKNLSEITENHTGDNNDFYYCIHISDLNITPGEHVNLLLSYVGEDGYTYEENFEGYGAYAGEIYVYDYPGFVINATGSKYGTPITINVTAKEYFTGDVVVKIGDVDVNVHVENGEGVNDTVLLPVGKDYSSYLDFAEQDYYHGGHADSNLFDVDKADSSVTVPEVRFVFDESDTVTVTVVNSTGEISAQLLDVDENPISIGQAVVENDAKTVTVSDLPLGNYKLKVTVAADDHYNSAYGIANVAVTKQGSNVVVHDVDDAVYGSQIVVTFTIPDDGNASGVQNPVIYNASGDVVSGIIPVIDNTLHSITIPAGLAVGTYTLNVTTVVDDNHENVTKSGTIVVGQAESSIEIEDITTVTYPNAVEINYETNSTVTVVAVYVKGTTTEVGTVTQGNKKVTVSGLGAGNYIVNITAEDENHSAHTESKDFSVDPIDNEVTLSIENTHYSDYINIYISGAQVAGTYVVTCEGNNVNVDVSEVSPGVFEGSTSVRWNLAVGTDYEASVSLDNSNYTTWGTDFFDITPKDNAVTLTIGNVKYGEKVLVEISNALVAGTYRVNLTDGKYVNVVVNDESAILLSGSAYADWDLAVGTGYPASVSLDNSNYTTSGSTTFDITVAGSDVVVPASTDVSYDGSVNVDVTAVNATDIDAKLYNADGTEVGFVSTSGSGSAYVVRVNVAGLPLGTYTLNVTTEVDTNHSAVTRSGSIVVGKAGSDVIVPASTTVDSGSSVVVTVSGLVNATGIAAELYQGLTKVSDLPVSDNKITVDATSLSAGAYTLKVTTIPDENHTAVTKSGNIAVYAYSNVAVTGASVTYDGNTTATISGLSGASGVNAELYKGSVKVRDLSVSGNSIAISAVDLDVGQYTLKVTTIPAAYYYAVSKTSTVTVTPADSTIKDISPIVMTYGDSSTVTVETTGATGIKANLFSGSILIPNKVTVNGNAVTIADVDVGQYTLKVTTVVDGNHKEATATAGVNVTKANVNMDISAGDVTYPGDIVVTVKSDVAGNYSLFVGTASPQDIVLEANVAKEIPFSGLNAGTYEFTLAYLGSDNYNAGSKSVNATVGKADVDMSVVAGDVTYPNNVVVTVMSDVAGNYSLSVGTASPQDIVLEANVAKEIPFSGLNAGTYEFTLAYLGSDNYNAGSKSANATVAKADVDMTILALNVTYPEPVVVTVMSDVAGKYSLFLDTTSPQYITLEALKPVDVNFGVLSAGTYKFTLAYLESENYNAGTESIYETVAKAENITMTIDATSPLAGENVTVTVTLPANATGNVEVKYGNGVYTAPVADGIAVIGVPTNASGTENATVKYSGDNNYASASSEVEITVEPNGVIIAENIKRGVNSPYDYYATLVDINGNPVNGVEITFTIAGKTYKAITNASGIATVSAGLGLEKDKDTVYNVTVTNPYTFENITATTTIVPRLIVVSGDLTADYLENPPYIVQAIGDDGNPVGAGEVVQVIFAGFGYNLTTNATGHVIRTIGLAPGQYAVKACYEGYNTTATVFIVKQVMKVTSGTLKKTAKSYTLKATLKSSNGKAIVGKQVKLTFNGQTYIVKTNSKGVASYTIKSGVISKLKAGKTYTLKAQYVNDVVKGKIKVVKK